MFHYLEQGKVKTCKTLEQNSLKSDFMYFLLLLFVSVCVAFPVFIPPDVPNSGRDLTNLDYRTKEWDVSFRKYIKSLDEQKPVVWAGDLNVAHHEIGKEGVWVSPCEFISVIMSVLKIIVISCLMGASIMFKRSVSEKNILAYHL